MYGPKKAFNIEHRELIKHLALYGYQPVTLTPDLWKNDTKPTIFTLVVDNSAIKYLNIYDAEHLFSVLRDKY